MWLPRPSAVISFLHFLAALALLTGPSRAEIDLQPGIIGGDNRQPVDNSAAPWTAIGQVNVGGYRKRSVCTGTLIAPRVVLTAAHCVIDAAKKKPFAAKDIHFVAGVRKDKSVGQSIARCVKFPGNFRYVGPERLLPDLPFQSVPFANFKLDLAIIVLAGDIPGAGTIDALNYDAVRTGMALTHAAYPADRRYVLVADRACKAIWMNADIVATDCDTHVGSSGGPVLIEQSGTQKLAAVMVGIIARTATVAVPLAAWPNMPLKAECS